MPNESEDNFDAIIDFKRLFATLQSWAWLLLLVMVLAAVSAYIYSRRQTPVYEATTNILVTRNLQQNVGDFSQTLSLSEVVQTYVRRLSLDEFLEIVSQRLGYKVNTDNVNVSALTNTQVIQLKVQDVDPARAALIADTMVSVLGEQNATLQTGRYADAEQSLDTQIKDTETSIAGIQAQLDETRANAYNEQTSQAKSNMDAAVTAIKVTTLELEQLHNVSWADVPSLLSEKKISLPQQQALLAQHIAEGDALRLKLSSDPQVQADPKAAAALQLQIAEMDTKIEQTRQLIAVTQNEIEFLTSLNTEQSYISALVEKDNFLKTQQSLLASYQNEYSDLLSTGEATHTTNAIDNLKRSLDLYQNIYLNLLSSREDVKKQKLQNIPTIEQISPALVAEYPVKPRTLLNTLLGGLAGLILALIFVVLRDMTNNTIRDRAEVEQTLGTKVIGYILDIKDNHAGEGIYVGRAPRSPVAEAFRSLRTNLEFSGKQKHIKTILVTSGGPAEGKTTVASNLAASLSHSGKKVLLLDADLRNPRIHQYIGISNNLGLSDLINPEQVSDISDCIQKLENFPDLRILPSGELPSDPTDLLGSEKMQALLGTLSGLYDYVVLDCPPLFVPDTQVLMGLVDGVLLLVVPGKTSKEVVTTFKEQMQNAGVHLLGVVFARLRHSRWARYGGYSYYPNKKTQ